MDNIKVFVFCLCFSTFETVLQCTNIQADTRCYVAGKLWILLSYRLPTLTPECVVSLLVPVLKELKHGASNYFNTELKTLLFKFTTQCIKKHITLNCLQGQARNYKKRQHPFEGSLQSCHTKKTQLQCFYFPISVQLLNDHSSKPLAPIFKKMILLSV